MTIAHHPIDAHVTLSEDESRLLLSQAHVGRIGVAMGGLPVILPVNFCMVDGFIMFFTGSGTKLRAASNNAVVAFEVDHIDTESGEGWCVSVIGVAHEIANPATHGAARGLGLTSWSGERDRLVAISVTHIWGSRFTNTPSDHEPYSSDNNRMTASAG